MFKLYQAAGLDDHSIVASALKDIRQLGWDEESTDDFAKNLAMALFGGKFCPIIVETLLISVHKQVALIRYAFQSPCIHGAMKLITQVDVKPDDIVRSGNAFVSGGPS